MKDHAPWKEQGWVRKIGGKFRISWIKNGDIDSVEIELRQPIAVSTDLGLSGSWLLKKERRAFVHQFPSYQEKMPSLSGVFLLWGAIVGVMSAEVHYRYCCKLLFFYHLNFVSLYVLRPSCPVTISLYTHDSKPWLGMWGWCHVTTMNAVFAEAETKSAARNDASWSPFGESNRAHPVPRWTEICTFCIKQTSLL